MPISNALDSCYKYKLTDALDTVLSQFKPTESFKEQYWDYAEGNYTIKRLLSNPCFPLHKTLEPDEHDVLTLYMQLDKKSDEFAKLFIAKFKQQVPMRNNYQTLE